MNFIELTDGFGDKVLVNFDKVEFISERTEGTKKFAELELNEGSIYVQEAYEQVKELLKSK